MKQKNRSRHMILKAKTKRGCLYYSHPLKTISIFHCIRNILTSFGRIHQNLTQEMNTAWKHLSLIT